MALIDIKVPDIGDFKEVAVIELLVKPGDTVKPEQSLITVESDKASMEIPSSHAGVVKELKVKLGDKVAEGSIVLTLDVVASPQGAATPNVIASPQGEAIPLLARRLLRRRFAAPRNDENYLLVASTIFTFNLFPMASTFTKS